MSNWKLIEAGRQTQPSATVPARYCSTAADASIMDDWTQMTTAFQQLLAEHYPQESRKRWMPRRNRRSYQIRVAMRKLRAKRRARGLNNAGKPMKAANRKFVNRKYRKQYEG